jgi:hypothetical protein
MPGSNRLAYGNFTYDTAVSPTTSVGATAGTLVWSTASLTANQTAELTATVPGLLIGDLIDLYLVSAAMTTGLTIANVRVSAVNVMAVTWINATAGTVTVPTATWNMNLSRPESPGSLPTNAL